MFNASYIRDDPGLINWPHWAGNPCPTILQSLADLSPPSNSCEDGKYPSYVVAARNAKDVSTAIKWAAKANVRVIIKNTGHDFLGR
jgi:hypothetical protein